MYKPLILLLLFVLFSSCSKVNDPLASIYSEGELMEFREIAWNDLSADEILTSTISKEQSRIQYGTVSCEDGIWYYKIENNSKCSFGLTNPDINFRTAQRFIIITINTRDDALLGPIVVIVEPNIKQVFGRATRE